MKTVFTFILLIITLGAYAQFEQPFEWKVDHSGTAGNLIVSVRIPEGHYLYSDQTSVDAESEGENLKPENVPASIPYTDEFGEHNIYPEGKTYSWIYPIKPDAPYKVKVNFQGCKDKTEDSSAICFMPSSEEFVYKQDDDSTPKIPEEIPGIKQTDYPNLNNILDGFETVKTGGGYLNSEEFLDFLDTGEHKQGEIERDSPFDGKSILGVILFIIIGGLALNLTPCVLPMIPINLAIIGAGSEAKTKWQGFIKGGVYGLAIALSYGVLGVVTVLTGAKFGTLNSSPVFNFIIAGVFILLALAMFDVITIDFSKYSAKFSGPGGNKSALIAIFAMGIVAALLAGACVSPVVIAVLLYSTTIYLDGSFAGLLLPFLLGVGMALPWPLAGGGMVAIPKPGKWMVKIKYGFGVLIIGFALYYGYEGYKLVSNPSKITVDSSFEALEKGLAESEKLNKPVFIDFWATWCKNCLAMDKTTFKDPEVKKRLEDYIFVKFQAEDLKDPRTKEILDRYKIPGLPGFVIIKKKP